MRRMILAEGVRGTFQIGVACRFLQFLRDLRVVLAQSTSWRTQPEPCDGLPMSQKMPYVRSCVIWSKLE